MMDSLIALYEKIGAPAFVGGLGFGLIIWALIEAASEGSAQRIFALVITGCIALASAGFIRQCQNNEPAARRNGW